MKECLVLFARYPRLGEVKTRLSPALSKKGALRLYSETLKRALAAAENSLVESRVYCCPPADSAAFGKLCGGKFVCSGQKGRGLGERMKNAFEEVFREGYSRAVLIGSDIPGLSAKLVRRAFGLLEENGAVLGPAFDGGYYLIGFKRRAFFPEIFASMPWGGCRVLAETRKALKKRKLAVAYLPRLRDLDTADDLKYFSKWNKTWR